MYIYVGVGRVDRVDNVRNKNSSYFVKWIFNYVKIVVCDNFFLGLKMFVIFIDYSIIYNILYIILDGGSLLLRVRRLFGRVVIRLRCYRRVFFRRSGYSEFMWVLVRFCSIRGFTWR